MTRIFDLLPIMVAATGIVVAQAHGGWFWVGLLGSAPLGWAVSGMWEAASVWLWWRGDVAWPHRLAKWAATAALVGGMIAQGAGPLLVQGEAGQQAAATRETAKEALTKLLVAIVDQERKGFKDTLDTLVAAALEAPSAAAPADSGPGPDGKKQISFPASWKPALAWTPVAAFPVLYALALLALVSLARERGEFARPRAANRPANPSPGIARKAAPEQASPQDSQPSRERRAVAEFGRRHGLEFQSQVAAKAGVAPSTLSEFVNGKAGPEQRAEIMEKLTTR